MEEKLLKIINHYGVLPQLKYFQSEVYELGEAIWEYQSSGWDFDYEDCEELEKKYSNHIAEEIADVIVMLKQFQYYYEIEDKEIEEVMKYKINRQLERISNIKDIVYNCSQNNYFYKYDGKYLKSEIIEQLTEELEKGEW